MRMFIILVDRVRVYVSCFHGSNSSPGGSYNPSSSADQYISKLFNGAVANLLGTHAIRNAAVANIAITEKFHMPISG